MELFDTSMTTLERAMDLRMTNQRLIASNLANVDTPGYVAQKLDFEQSMKNALAGAADPAIVQDSTAPALSLDGNNVDMESELGDMTQNRVLYSVTAQVLGAKFRQLSTAFQQE